MHIERAITEYLRSNMGMFILVCLFFVIGVVIGTVTVGFLDTAQKAQLANFLRLSIRTVAYDDVLDRGLVVRASLVGNCKLLFVNWILGMTVIGLVLIPLVVIAKGFTIGFTVAFIVEELGLEGVILSLVSIFPPNFFAVPAVLLSATAGMSLSKILLRHRILREKGLLVEQFVGYTILVAFLSTLFLAGSLVDAYVVPVFLKTIGPFVA